MVMAGSGPGASVQVTDSNLTSTTRTIGIAGPFPNISSTTPQNSAVPAGPYLTFSAGQTVPVTIGGLALCQFDNQIQPGDYIAASTFNTGFCHSVGSTVPASDQIVGVALSENGPGSFGQPFAQVILLFNGSFGSTTAGN
jgi:hypothetical protein